MNDCIFCQIVEGTAKSWKVYETDRTYAFFDIYPVNEYHTLVIPKAHYVNLYDVPNDELLEVITTLKHVVDLYHNTLNIEDMQVVQCSRTVAQQDLFHLHFHIVLRYAGDQNDIHWKTHPEMRERFDHLLSRLQ